jgi:hypothetical protein
MNRFQMRVMGDVPHKRHQFTRNGYNDYVFVFSASGQLAVTGTQAYLRFPGDLAGFDRQVLLSDLDFTTHLGRVAIGPSRLDQIASGMAVAAFGDRTQPGVLSERVL